MDYTLSLAPELEKEFMSNMKNYEEEVNMPYITSAQRIGREEGNRNLLQVLIEKKFGKLTPVLSNLLENANTRELEQMAIQVLTATDVNELFNLPVNDSVTV